MVCDTNKEYLLLCPLRASGRQAGKKRALVAIAAEMLKVVYHMLKDGTAYREPGANYMDDRRRQNQIDYYKKRLKELGEDSPEKESA